MSYTKISYLMLTLISSLAFTLLIGTTVAEQCGKQADGALCPNNLCCSKFGYCGNTNDYCGDGCQSQCKSSTPTTPPNFASGDVGKIVTSSIFDQMLKYRNNPRCKGNGFYSYNTFIAAARSFGGDDATKKKEVAAFWLKPLIKPQVIL
ncbi:hypothetical protein HN51_052175 [Arachis hypogaea]|uniref:chitinase n=1 Tax=Arachis hypogaea TaxID=3818 RepID=A0A445CBT7_ARAHY|nr:endochitinase-like [Arachis hypogaea]RYR48388.1 hypothetical protein Ahy_A07g034409 [Arachis hypogaea]